MLVCPAVFKTVVGGEELPAALESAIPQLPLSITTGTYVVSSFNEGGSLQPAKRLDLSPDGYRLYISPTDEAGVFSLTPEHKEGNPPRCLWCISQ